MNFSDDDDDDGDDIVNNWSADRVDTYQNFQILN